MNLRPYVPNTITLLNLFSGCIALHFAFQQNYLFAFYFVALGIFLDFFDGFFARMFHVSGPLGVQLDSLADMVTFGALSAFIVFSMLQEIYPESYLPFLAFFIATQSAIRLAKFNIDTRQSDRFIGVPTPANGLLISTLPFMAEEFEWAGNFIYNGPFLIGFTLVFALLLTADLPLIALKFKKFTFKDNKYRYLTLIISLICFLTMGIAGIPAAIISYVLLSILENLENRNAPTKSPL